MNRPEEIIAKSTMPVVIGEIAGLNCQQLNALASEVREIFKSDEKIAEVEARSLVSAILVAIPAAIGTIGFDVAIFTEENLFFIVPSVLAIIVVLALWEVIQICQDQKAEAKDKIEASERQLNDFLLSMGVCLPLSISDQDWQAIFYQILQKNNAFLETRALERASSFDSRQTRRL